jgi:hypothetical protein
VASKQKTAHCPECQFSYAWNGKKCGHCHPPDKQLRKRWANFESLDRLLHPKRTYSHRQLTAVAAACLRRAWNDLPQYARKNVQKLEAGAPVELLLPMVRNLSRERNDVAFEAQPVANWDESANEINWVMVTRVVANIARRLVGLRTFPDRPLSSFPLPPHLERYRGEVDEFAASRRQRPRQAGRATPPVRERRNTAELRKAYEHASGLDTGYNHQRRLLEHTEEIAQCDIARDVIGYPEANVHFESGWKTSTACAIARGMHGSGDFSAMPILADALEDAGCSNSEVLSHCRSTKTHFHGCWVISCLD